MKENDYKHEQIKKLNEQIEILQQKNEELKAECAKYIRDDFVRSSLDKFKLREMECDPLKDEALEWFKILEDDGYHNCVSVFKQLMSNIGYGFFEK